MVECRQVSQKSVSLDTGVQFISERTRGGVILNVLTVEEAHCPLERAAVEKPAPEQHLLERLQELQCAPDADAERFDARLEALQIATLEDPSERLLATFFELVSFDAL